jgi:hypothetical protein
MMKRKANKAGYCFDTVLDYTDYQGNLKEVFLGVCSYGEHVTAELKESGEIAGFNTYDLVSEDNTACGNKLLSHSAWCHSVEISGETHKSGDILDLETFKPKATQDDIEELSGYDIYKTDTASCEVCGTVHDTQEVYPTYTIVDECSLVCLGCRTAEDVLVPLEKPEDLFNALNADSVDIDEDEYQEVGTLFCDSSGLGDRYEPALTKIQAEKEAEDLIKEHGKDLFCAITDIGQFQVYVTVWKRKRLKLVQGGAA